jgi:methyl-accepting chemotaxis protein
MLTQRMAYQLLGYSRTRERGQDSQEQRQAILLTLQVFEKTLEALDRGGPAPMDLQMVNMREAPAASGAVAAQLGRVRKLYVGYERNARAVLEGTTDERQLGEAYIVGHNSELLSEMNTAVSILQSEVETRVRQLYYIQGGALLIGLLAFWLLSSYLQRSIAEPLRQLSIIADSISHGELYVPVEPSGPKEVARLGASVERLRIAMKALVRTDAGGELTGL